MLTKLVFWVGIYFCFMWKTGCASLYCMQTKIAWKLTDWFYWKCLSMQTKIAWKLTDWFYWKCLI